MWYLRIIDFNKEIEAKSHLTENMAEKITHRGPDDKGQLNDENVSLGFRRLSILDVKNETSRYLALTKI